MKQKLLTILYCVGFALSAETAHGGALGFYLGTNMSRLNYREPDINISHRDSYVPGFTARIVFDQRDTMAFYGYLTGKYQSGTYDYQGYSQNLAGIRTPLSMSDLPKVQSDAEVGFGHYVWSFPADISLKLFGGIQYEHIDDQAYTVNRTFYGRTRDSWFGVIGMGINKKIGERRQVGIMLKAKPVIASWHEANLSDVGGVYADVPAIRQRQPRGFRFGASINYQDKYFWFEPYLVTTNLSATKPDNFCLTPNVCGTIHEPSNTSLEMGMNMGIYF